MPRLDRHSDPRGQRSLAAGRQGGVALLAVMAFVAVVTTIVFEFSSNTTVDAIAAANARDSMRAHFLNRSGANLGQLIVKVQTDVLDRYRQYLGDIQLADYAGLFMGAFGGGQDEVEAVAALVGGFEGDAIKGLGVTNGSFDVQISTEDGKLNMNCANGSQTTRNNLQTMLEAVVYFDAYDPIFESPDAEGWQRDRSEQVSALMDYIDRDRSKASQSGTPEEYGYSSLDDDYEPKDNYLDSVGELALVRGVDDRFWTLFGGIFTIYGDCKLNIGAVEDPKLFAALIFLAAKSQDDPVLRDSRMLWRLAKRVAEARSYGVYFDDLNAFVEFVKSPDGSLDSLLGSPDAASNPLLSGAQAAAQGLEPVEGVELDPAKLGQVARAGPRRIYRVEVTSTIPRPHVIGDVSRRLTAIWDTQVQNQNARDPSYRQGTWVFWREE